MSNSLKTVDPETSPADVMDLLPETSLAPWEDHGQFAALEAALIAEMKPKTLHERSIVRRLAECHWDHSRSRTLSSDVAKANYRAAALQALMTENGLLAKPLFADQAMLELVDGLLASDTAVRTTALEALAKCAISESDIRARAYLDHFHAVEALERRPVRLDERRRALMKEYDDVRSLNALKAVAEAEVIAADDQ